MNHNSPLFQAAHASHYLPHKQGQQLRKAMFWTVVAVGTVGAVSAMTGFAPGVALSASLFSAWNGSHRN